MTRFHQRFLAGFATIALALFAFASVQAQDMISGDDFAIENVQPFGDLTTEYTAYDNPDTGAIILTHSTPTDQHANFDVVGPFDFWQHFDFSDDEGAEYVIDDLTPGFYSIAASDEGLELVHTVVEVRAGEAVAVNANLTTWEEGWTPGSYDPTGTYGTYEGYEGVYPGYPYGAYTVGDYTTFGAADTGALAIESVSEETDVVVTGPNGYSEGFENPVVVEGLAPGVYAVAASGDDTDLAVTTVEIQAERQLPIDITTVSLQGSQSEGAGATVSDEMRGSTDGLAASFDSDGNDQISVADFRVGVFDLWDANDDDVLTQDEFDRGVETMYGGEVDFSFPELDADGDGEIAITEWQENYPADVYADFDANDDDVVTWNEFSTGFYNLMDVDGDGTLLADDFEQFENWVGRTFGDLDADGDGELTTEEFGNAV